MENGSGRKGWYFHKLNHLHAHGSPGMVFESLRGGSETVSVSLRVRSGTVSVVKEWIRNSVCCQGVG